MNITQIVNEKVRDTVFHVCDLEAVQRIFSSNSLLAVPLIGEDKKFFFVATANSRNSEYVSAALKRGKNLAVIQLNGQKLNADLKSKSVDFFLNHKNTEVSDKIFSDHPNLTNIREYIQQISIFTPSPDTDLEKLKAIKKLSEDSEIHTLFFNDAASLLGNNRTTALKLDDVKIPAEVQKERTADLKNEAVLAGVLWLNENNDPDAMDEKYSDLLRDITIDSSRGEIASRIEIQLSSHHKNNGLESKPYVRQFAEAMNARGVRNINDFIDKISAKWKMILTRK